MYTKKFQNRSVISCVVPSTPPWVHYFERDCWANSFKRLPNGEAADASRDQAGCQGYRVLRIPFPATPCDERRKGHYYRSVTGGKSRKGRTWQKAPPESKMRRAARIAGVGVAGSCLAVAVDMLSKTQSETHTAGSAAYQYVVHKGVRHTMYHVEMNARTDSLADMHRLFFSILLLQVARRLTALYKCELMILFPFTRIRCASGVGSHGARWIGTASPLTRCRTSCYSRFWKSTATRCWAAIWGLRASALPTTFGHTCRSPAIRFTSKAATLSESSAVKKIS